MLLQQSDASDELELEIFLQVASKLDLTSSKAILRRHALVLRSLLSDVSPDGKLWIRWTSSTE
ncbi:hypothetical protein C2845_PM02G43780 [Panicum miliaceum]|uniref:Uncharacterized protein n=1 Tax=Panicum miliaceum TaxID=4540 RepID=A0A3L6SCA8_PANMI|nr:hypothetical protein C2845_PM02G43780 [Panicum miliaceum]